MEDDIIKSPRHYLGNGEIECKDAMSSMMEGADVTNQQAYWWGCALKYLWRWPWKNGSQDIMKAIQCLAYLLNETVEVEDD